MPEPGTMPPGEVDPVRSAYQNIICMLDLTRWDRSSCKGILRLLLAPLMSDWVRMW